MSQTLKQKRALMADSALPERRRFLQDCIERTPISRPDTLFGKVCRYTVAAAWVAAVAAIIVMVQA